MWLTPRSVLVLVTSQGSAVSADPPPTPLDENEKLLVTEGLIPAVIGNCGMIMERSGNHVLTQAIGESLSQADRPMRLVSVLPEGWCEPCVVAVYSCHSNGHSKWT